jgi:hypothetical protein
MALTVTNKNSFKLEDTESIAQGVCAPVGGDVSHCVTAFSSSTGNQSFVVPTSWRGMHVDILAIDSNPEILFFTGSASTLTYGQTKTLANASVDSFTRGHRIPVSSSVSWRIPENVTNASYVCDVTGGVVQFTPSSFKAGER